MASDYSKSLARGSPGEVQHSTNRKGQGENIAWGKNMGVSRCKWFSQLFLKGDIFKVWREGFRDQLVQRDQAARLWQRHARRRRRWGWLTTLKISLPTFGCVDLNKSQESFKIKPKNNVAVAGLEPDSRSDAFSIRPHGRSFFYRLLSTTFKDFKGLCHARRSIHVRTKYSLATYTSICPIVCVMVNTFDFESKDSRSIYGGT